MNNVTPPARFVIELGQLNLLDHEIDIIQSRIAKVLSSAVLVAHNKNSAIDSFCQFSQYTSFQQSSLF
jgi:hypothetical protein